ncbi:TPA: lytic transglycosylase domain-containing protein [Pseudomonas aeruginosa]
MVEKLSREGASFDTGYGQIWSGNFRALGVSAVDMLEPCKNLAALDRILSDCYRAAVATNDNRQIALRHAISCYNTGNQRDGFTNGYVGKILAVAQANNKLKVPALRVDGVESGDDKVGKSVEREGELPADNKRPNRSGGFDEPTPDGFSNSTQDGFEVMARQYYGAPNEGLSHPAKTTRGYERKEEIDTDMDSEDGRKKMASSF